MADSRDQMKNPPFKGAKKATKKGGKKPKPKPKPYPAK